MMNCPSDPDTRGIEELSASALMLLDTDDSSPEIHAEEVTGSAVLSLDETPSDPTHPDPTTRALDPSDDEPSLEIHFGELAELSTPISEAPPPPAADLTPVGGPRFDEELTTPEPTESAATEAAVETNAPALGSCPQSEPKVAPPVVRDDSTTDELDLVGSEDLTVKKRPSWTPPAAAAPDAFDDDEDADDQALTARRLSPLPPAPSWAPAPRRPHRPTDSSSTPFQSAPVVERPFGRALRSATPRLPPPPRVPSFAAPAAVGVGAGRRALPQSQRPLPLPSPLPVRPASQPPMWPYPKAPSLPPIKALPSRHVAPNAASPNESRRTSQFPEGVTREHPIPTERVRTRAPFPQHPITPPPIPLRRVRTSRDSTWDDSASTARTSLMPFGFAVDAVKQQLRRGSLPLAAGAAMGLALFLLTLFWLQAPRSGAAAEGGPVLFVTVAGPNGRSVDEPRVFVDGALRCNASPCRVADVTAGMHFVSVAADGFATSAARVVRVNDSEPSALHLDLEPAASTKSANAAPADTVVPLASLPAQVAPARPQELPSIATQSLSAALSPAPSPAPSPTMMPTLGWGYLNLNSIPAANVVVDGKPLGSTPKIGVRVRAGNHEVVFVHPEHGRRTQSAFVSAGGKQTVAVRF